MPQIAFHTPTLYAAWNDHSLTVTEVARQCGLTTGQLYRVAREHALPPRPRQQRAHSLEEDATPEEDAESRDSLALATAVRRRILELGIGMPVAEHPDVRPWFAVTTEPGPYTDDPEEGYPYDE